MTGTKPWPALRAEISRTALSIAVASGAYGISFGALGTAAGLTVVQTCALSVLVFTGGSQFALIGTMAGAGPMSGVASAVLLGARNMLYGARLAPTLGLRGLRRFVGGQLVLDESTAVALAREPDGPRASRFGFWATGLAIFVLWNAATLLGALSGTAIGDPRDLGLDAAVPAAFLALLAPRLTGRQARIAGLLAVLVALALVPVVPAGVPVVAAAGVPVLVVLAARRRRVREP
jgi:predicted branched-subunit amino acid permease